MQALRLFGSSTFRLALIYAAVFSGSVLLLLVFLWWATAGYLVRQADATIEAEIGGLAERYRRAGLAGLTALIHERLSRTPAGSSIYLLADANLKPVIGNLDRWPASATTSDGWIDFNLQEVTETGPAQHRARARVFRLRGGFNLLVGRDIHELERFQAMILSAFAWGLGITVVLAVVGGTLISRGVLRRIENINVTSGEIMSGDLSRRIPVRGSGDDLDQLTENLNRMLDRIQSLMAGVRQVSDNIAHDLRTPLARLRTRLEGLRDRAESAASREALEGAVADADRLLETFTSLLRIARIESNSRREGFVDLTLDTLLGDVIELYAPVAEERGARIEADIARAVPFRGDRDLLFQALVNLIHNAITHAPRGTPIDLTLETPARGPRITVADAGPGIPESEREKVFQRFYRSESSRSTPGSGLGLSLVDAVARLHGIEVRLEDNRPGLRVVLDFPSSSARALDVKAR